jgi:hypothetical protein
MWPHPNRVKICLAVSPNRSDECDDRSPVKEKRMNTTTESEKNASAPEVPQPKKKRTSTTKAKPAKKAGRETGR